MANYGRSMGGSRRRRGRTRTTRRASGMQGGLPRRQSRTRSRMNNNMRTGRMNRPGSQNMVSMLPDLPPNGNFRHIVREGTLGKKATLFACPEPHRTPECVKLNDHQRKIISNGDPYSGV